MPFYQPGRPTLVNVTRIIIMGRAITIALLLLLVGATAELELVKTISHGDEDDADNDVTVAFSSTLLAAGTRSGEATIYDAWTGLKQRGIFRCDYDLVFSVALSDTTLALGGGTEGGELYNAETGERLRAINYGSRIRALSFSPDGLKLAAGGEAATSVYDVATGKVLREFPSDDAIYSVAFSPDGELLVWWLRGNASTRVKEERPLHGMRCLDARRGETATIVGDGRHGRHDPHLLRRDWKRARRDRRRRLARDPGMGAGFQDSRGKRAVRKSIFRGRSS